MAIYKFLFKHGYPFSYDLDELATYYVEYRKLMAHWKEILPDGHIFDIHYEKLVTNQREETQKLLRYLQLDWEAECMQFYTNRQTTATGSASQVRNPIHQSSVDKWKCYEGHLQPLVRRLEASGLRISR